MLKIIFIITFLSLETLADSRVDSEKWFKSTKNPFMDLTEAINQRNISTIENTLNFTSNVYYSTSQLVSEIENLSWVSTLLSNIYENDQPDTNVSLCLILSFQITKNRSDIDWRYINDVLNRRNTNLEENGNDQHNLKILGQSLCGVTLNFEVNEPKNIEYQRSQAYAEKWNISFTKYAKLILENIFGVNKTIPVGLMYSESQVKNQDRVLLEQEIIHADFVIVNVNQYPLIDAHLHDWTFSRHLSDLKRQNREYIWSSAYNATSNFDIPFKFMVTWNEYQPSRNLNCLSCLAKDQVFLSSQSLYRQFFIGYVQSRLRFSSSYIGFVSGVVLDSKRRGNFDYTLDFSSYGHTYLHFQESDTTACQLGGMLETLSSEFSNVVVNEYALSALNIFYAQITNEEYMKSQCGNKYYRRVSLPKNLKLFPSLGIGHYWNQTGSTFTKLLQTNQRYENLTITTIVFAADDLNSGTEKFIKSQVQGNTTKIGCLVDITGIISHDTTSSAQEIIEFVKQKCHSILSDSTILVWQIQIDNQTATYETFASNSEKGSLKSNLINMLIARQLYKAINPNQEIMFRVANDTSQNNRNGTDCPSFGNHFDSSHFDHLLLKWGAFHKVKILPVMPGFDLNNPLKGYALPPYETVKQSYKNWIESCS